MQAKNNVEFRIQEKLPESFHWKQKKKFSSNTIKENGDHNSWLSYSVNKNFFQSVSHTEWSYVFRRLYMELFFLVLFAFWWPLTPAPIHCMDKKQLSLKKKKKTFSLVQKLKVKWWQNDERMFIFGTFWVKSIRFVRLNYVNMASLNLEKVTHALPSFRICTFLASQLFWHPNTGKEIHLFLETKTVQSKL